MMHLCLEMSFCLLNQREQCWHCSGPWTCDDALGPLATMVVVVKLEPESCSVTHRCTASPPLLRNQWLHVGHCSAPRCSHTGLWHSAVHLCLTLSHSLRKYLPHTEHCTWPCAWAWLCCRSSISWPYILCQLSLDRVASYHSSFGMAKLFRSLRITSFHLFLGGGVCPATQKETASGCGRQAFGPDVQSIPICALLLWKLPFQYRPTGSLLPPR